MGGTDDEWRTDPGDPGNNRSVLQLEVLENAEEVASALSSRGAAVSRDGLQLEVMIADSDPYDLIMRTLAETGTGLRLIRPSVTTLEDAYFSEDQGTS